MAGHLATAFLVATSVTTCRAAVAIGIGQLNPSNPSECLDPDTGSNHTLGVAWNIPGVCGQAHCELRSNKVYISYAFCGSAQAEAPCHLSSTDLSLPYPYCCPRSICPARTDVHTNFIDTDDYEDELQMAASFQPAGGVRVAAPEGFLKGSHSHGQELQEDRAQDNQDNMIVSYDTNEAEDLSTGEEEEEYPDIHIDWTSFISSMPSPFLLERK